MKPTFPVVMSLVVWSALSAGCAKKQVAVKAPPPPVVHETPPVAQASRTPVVARPQTPPAQPALKPVAQQPDTATRARIQDLLNRIQDAYFDYNQQNIRPDAEAALKVDAQALSDILRQFPGYKLTVEGYCDERGSDAYNLALGDARARRAKSFLADSGIPDSQLRIVSFGKERPVCTEPTEECWQRNRRAHITQAQ